MFHSIKTKLIVVVSMLVIVVMTGMAIFLVRSKIKDTTFLIYQNSVAYAELTSGEVINGYKMYYEQGGFVQFQRTLRELLAQTSDLDRIVLTKFSGEVIYDSKLDIYSQYKGDERTIASDSDLLLRVQSPIPSVNVIGDKSRVVYLEKDVNNVFFEVDSDGRKVDQIKPGDRIGTVVYPVNGEFAVLYDVNYEAFDRRIVASLPGIGLLILIATFSGIAISIYIGTRISRPVSHLKDGALEIAKGNFDYIVPVETSDEIGILSQTFNEMGKELKNSIQAKLYKERVVKELEIAKGIQRSLIPKSIPSIKGLSITASVAPAEEIGGDCYDFLPIDDKRTIMYLGDVTGHGVPSGLLVSVVNALICSYAENEGMFDILVKTNRIMKMKSQPNMFITMVMMTWHSEEKIMKYISAGHEKILKFDAKIQQVVELESGGIALGMLPDCSKLLKEKDILVNQGDYLVVYSDGIPEAWNEKGELYGMGNLRKTILNSILHSEGEISAQSVHDMIVSDVRSYMGSAKQMDDITLMVIKVE